MAASPKSFDFFSGGENDTKEESGFSLSSLSVSLLGDCSARQNVQYIRLPHLSRSAPALVSLAIQQSGEDWPPLR